MAKETEPDESTRDWMTHPVTERWRLSYMQSMGKIMQNLLAKAMVSSDAEVRSLAATYTEQAVIVKALSSGVK